MELAVQIADVCRQMSQHMPNIKIELAIRGNRVPAGKQLESQVIIGTPGTAYDWGSPRIRAINFKKLKVFVLDEADVMIDQQGHQDTCIRVVKSVTLKRILLFSTWYHIFLY